MKSTYEILDAVRQTKQYLSDTFKLKTVGVFGSVVRGEHHDGSDVDLLVELDEKGDLLDLVGIGQYLENRLHLRVDVVQKESLRSELRAQILEEVRYL